MKIHGLTVCVDYADILALSLQRWLNGLDGLTVVTSLTDSDTVALVGNHTKVTIVKTDAFYRGGAAFNKGLAMEEALARVPWEDWLLFFDADVVPPADWRAIVERSVPTPGVMYGASRVQCDDPKDIDAPGLPRVTIDGIGVGFFQLFHVSDPVVQDRPLLETFWPHAGNYDNGFMHRWSRGSRKLLPLTLYHVGPRDNWFGRGHETEFDAMKAERERRGGQWEHERMEKTPVPPIWEDPAVAFSLSWWMKKHDYGYFPGMEEHRNWRVKPGIPDWFVEGASPGPDDDVLEVGCGYGEWMVPLAPMVKTISGFDIHHILEQKAKELLSGIPNATMKVSDGITIPFAANSFSLVYEIAVFMHIPRSLVLNYFREVDRVLRPGGRVLFHFKHNDGVVDCDDDIGPNGATFYTVGWTPEQVSDAMNSVGWTGRVRVRGDTLLLSATKGEESK